MVDQRLPPPARVFFKLWQFPEVGFSHFDHPLTTVGYYRKIWYYTIGAILCPWYRHLGETLRRRRISALPEIGYCDPFRKIAEAR